MDAGFEFGSFRTMTVVAPRERSMRGELLFIASTSFERRCTHVAGHLTSDYHADVALICDLRGDYEFQDERGLCLENLKGLLTFSTKAVEVCKLKTYDARGSLPGLDSLLERLAASHRFCQIDVDITTFTKQYILILLSLLERHFPLASVRVLYTPASQYGVPGKPRQALTKHVKEIVAVPGFDLFMDSSDVSCVLVALLGFEEERVLNLLDALSPKICVPVLQLRRNTHFGARIPFESNRRLLDLARARYRQEPRYVDAENPTSTAEFLFQIYQDYKDQGFALLVAPHGSKMQAVGTYLFYRAARDPKRIGVVYAVPKLYDQKHYSTDPIGYIAEFTLENVTPRIVCGSSA